jgi:hypothetical protein
MDNFACGSAWVKTCSLTLREEYRLRVFENKMLKEHLEQREMK